MNNNDAAGMVAVPAPVEGWQFFTALYGCEQEFGENEVERQLHRMQRRTLLVSLKSLSDIKCVACSGFGHTRRHCPTHARLTTLGQSSPEWLKLVAWTRL